MNSLEDRLAAELRRSFDEVPDAAGDLEAVKRVSSRRVFRVRAGTVVGAAALVLIAVGSVAVLRTPPVPEASAPTIATAPTTTTVTAVVDPSTVVVAAREFELNLDSWEEGPLSEMETRPLVLTDESEIEDIASAARDVLSEMGAEPPFTATLVQRTDEGQIVLLTHAAGSCITDLVSRVPWSVHSDPAPCMSTDEPAAWELGSLRVIVWEGIPASATRLTTSPDCGEAAFCLGDSALVVDGIAVFPTRWEGLTPSDTISIELVAYDRSSTEVASAVVVLPPKHVSPQMGLVISPDGVPIAFELPDGFEFDTFAVERRGAIVENSTQTPYLYRLLDRADLATSDEQIAVGEVSVGFAVIEGEERRAVMIGLERGTVLVRIPLAGAVDTALWSGAFIDVIGDGEAALVVQAGPGFALAVGSPATPRSGSQVDLVGADGEITFTTGGCFLDDATPSTDFDGILEEHDRAGAVLRDDGTALWCSSAITVRAEGAEGFIEAMLNGLSVGQ